MPREGHDCNIRCPPAWRRCHFYPRAPGGARPLFGTTAPATCTFLSTCPGRGTTAASRGGLVASGHFYPRAPGGARQYVYMPNKREFYISIHVPREGHDYLLQLLCGKHSGKFLSTCPGRGTTMLRKFSGMIISVFLSTCPGRGTTSVTVTASGPDTAFLSTCPGRGTTGRRRTGHEAADNFYPRAPGGARQPLSEWTLGEVQFLSTCPGRGTTALDGLNPDADSISIHVPREGHDAYPVSCIPVAYNFYPRAPGGARPLSGQLQCASLKISIHVPREGHDQARLPQWRRTQNFYPRAPGGARHGGRYHRAVH